MSLFSSVWDVVGLLFWGFVFISALMAMIMILSDLFRDRNLSGWFKAIWIVFLVFVPLITSLVYLIVRGKGMSERLHENAKANKDATDAYIRDVAGTTAADEIAKAKALLDDGAITLEEYEALKGRVLNS